MHLLANSKKDKRRLLETKEDKRQYPHYNVEYKSDYIKGGIKNFMNMMRKKETDFIDNNNVEFYYKKYIHILKENSQIKNPDSGKNKTIQLSEQAQLKKIKATGAGPMIVSKGKKQSREDNILSKTFLFIKNVTIRLIG